VGKNRDGGLDVPVVDILVTNNGRPSSRSSAKLCDRWRFGRTVERRRPRAGERLRNRSGQREGSRSDLTRLERSKSWIAW